MTISYKVDRSGFLTIAYHTTSKAFHPSQHIHENNKSDRNCVNRCLQSIERHLSWTWHAFPSCCTKQPWGSSFGEWEIQVIKPTINSAFQIWRANFYLAQARTHPKHQHELSYWIVWKLWTWSDNSTSPRVVSWGEESIVHCMRTPTTWSGNLNSHHESFHMLCYRVVTSNNDDQRISRVLTESVADESHCRAIVRLAWDLRHNAV